MGDARVVTAAVLIIGNEILSGRTRDVNLAYLATGLTAARHPPARRPAWSPTSRPTSSRP